MKSLFGQYLEQIINEVFVADDVINENYVKIYKNPKMLDGMQDWLRGVVLRSGDLYVFDIENVEVDKHDFIHADAIGWMNRNLPNFSSSYEELSNPLDHFNKFITVDRSGNTNTFVLAESYDLEEVEEFRDELNKYVAVFKRKNPNLELVIFAEDNE